MRDTTNGRATGRRGQGRRNVAPQKDRVHRLPDPAEVRHQGAGLPLRVVLAEGDEVVVLPGQQLADVPRRAAEAVVLKCQVWEQDFFSFFVNGIK